MKLCLACDNAFVASDWQCSHCQFTPGYLEEYLAFSPSLAKENSGFEPEFFKELAELEKKNFWFKSRNRLIAWALQYYFPHAKNFLEIGCGTGFVLDGIERQFPALKLSGSEIYSEGLKFAAKRIQNGFLFQMDARKIPFLNEFDVMGAFDVLEHIEEDELVLQQMHQALKPHAGLILTVPQHPFLWSKQDEYACHVRRYTKTELVNKVEKAGFRVLKTTSFVSFLLPLMLLSRLKNKKTENFDVLKEFRINPILNGILEKIQNLENYLIRLGLVFPAGGSLLLIAQRDA